MHTRYVDDILVVIDDLSGKGVIKANLHEESVPRFIREPEKNGKLAFQDCLGKHFSESYQTSMDTKYTSSRDCLNFISKCSKICKNGAIKALFHGGCEILSTMEIFYTDIERIKLSVQEFHWFEIQLNLVVNANLLCVHMTCLGVPMKENIHV